MKNQTSQVERGYLQSALFEWFCIVMFWVFPGLVSAQDTQPADPLRVPSSSNQQVSSPGTTAVEGDERYRIGAGDVIEVLVYNQPQLSRPAIRVDGRGMIRLPLLEGEIQAACKTESELRRELTTRYLEYQKYPQVDVFVKEFNSQLVVVMGAVNSPGRFQLQRRVRLFEILTLAGGPSAMAGRTVQILNASSSPMICEDDQESGRDEVKNGISFYSLGSALRAEETANPYLRPGDVVTILEAEQVYIMGNVQRPAPISLKEPLTISRAIIMAGGLLPDTDSHRIRVIRQPPGVSAKTELLVNLKEINKGAAEDIQLQANDVVEIPPQGGVKAVLKGVMRTMVPAISHLPMRIIY